MLLFEKNRLVLSENIIGSRIYEAFNKLLTQSRNTIDLNTEHCRTPHVTDKKSVLLLSSI